jgi:hypothetical protein
MFRLRRAVLPQPSPLRVRHRVAFREHVPLAS